MKTPLEVIQEGEREFKRKCELYSEVGGGFSDYSGKLEKDRIEEWNKRQTKHLLQALRAELEGRKVEPKIENDVFLKIRNGAIQDQIDSYDKLIKELTT